jgi:hypothetical protein
VQTLSGEEASLFALVALFIVRGEGRSGRMRMGRVRASSLSSAFLHLCVPPSPGLLPNEYFEHSDATPLYTLRDDNDTKDLKAQVDRLQHLLDALTEQTPPLRSNSGRDYLDSGSRPHLEHRHSGPAGSSRLEDGVESEEEEPEATFDLHAIGLCEALSELALNGVMPPQQSGTESFAPGGGSGEVFVDEARQFLLTFTHRLGLSKDLPFTILTPSSSEQSPNGSYDSPDVHMPPSDHLSAASGSSSRISSPSALGLSAALLNVRPSQSHLLDLLPTIEEIEKTYTFYSQYVHWYSSPLDLVAIQRQWPAFRTALAEEDSARREAAVDPLFVATVLAACASGLASMTNKQARARGFPEDRSALVERWTQASVLGLVVGKFLEEPSIEGLVAATVLGSLYVVSPSFLLFPSFLSMLTTLPRRRNSL